MDDDVIGYEDRYYAKLDAINDAVKVDKFITHAVDEAHKPNLLHRRPNYHLNNWVKFTQQFCCNLPNSWSII